jgi:predicted phosphodiesterase
VRILALYDIHGNIDALEAVLADPRAAGADAVVVGGDVSPGAFVGPVLDRLAALRPPVHYVRGNGERETASMVGAPAPDPADGMLVSAAAAVAELGDARALALGEWPETAELDHVLFCHATPTSDSEILTRISSDERWAAALRGCSGLVVAGHTHQQDDRRVGEARFVNAGSVGLPYEGDGAARWLWLEDGEPDLRVTEYDALAAGRRMLEAGWDAESISASLLEPLPAIEVTRMFEDRATA